MSRVAILGAGPAGLSAALALAQRGFEVDILEQEAAVGGLSGSFDVDGIRVDYGSHRLHPATSPPLLAQIRTLLGDDLVFSGNPAGDRAITDQWEIAGAIGRRDSRIPIWFLNFDMLGLGYRFSSNGDLQGITFVFRSMFDD